MVDSGINDLNKSVEQIIKMLGAGLSPADQKNLAEMKADTAKQEKDQSIRDKKQKEEEKKGWSEGINTWGQVGKIITKSVKNWFNKAMKANTLLGSTLRMGANIWKNLNEHIIQNLRQAFNAITGHIREVLGPVAEAFDAVKNVFTGVFKFFKGVFMGIGAKVAPEDKFRNKMLQKILRTLDSERRAKFRQSLDQKKEKKSGLVGILLVLGMVAAALIGAAMRKFLLPFELAWKAVMSSRVGKAFRALSNWFGKTKIGTKIGKWIKKFSGFWDDLLKRAKWLGKIAKGLKFGFKILGWPLTIIIGIIDFIRGFMSTEGNLWDKIKGGLKAAIFGFIEMPVRFISWIIETVAGWFGVQMEGTAGKIMTWLGDFLDGFFEIFQNLPVISFLTGFFSTEGTFMEKLKGGFDNMIKGVVNIFVKLWNGIVDLAYKLLPDWLVEGSGIKKISVPGNSAADTGSVSDANSKSKLSEEEARRRSREKLQKDELESKRLAKEQLEATKAATAATATAVGGQGGPGGGGGGETVPQIPDEVDNWGITSKNSDMEMMRGH